MLEITTREAIRTYNIGANLLYRWITSGEIKTRKNRDGRWLIRKDSIEQRNRKRLARTREQNKSLNVAPDAVSTLRPKP